MRLYAEYALLSGGTCPSAAAYALLRHAGHNPDVHYVTARGARVEHDGSPRLQLPILVTDEEVQIATLGEIQRWVASQVAA